MQNFASRYRAGVRISILSGRVISSARAAVRIKGSYYLGLIGLVLACFSNRVSCIEPLAALPLNSTENSDKVNLGERLFHDSKLSGKPGRSCATCHPLDQGAMDGKPRAEAIDGVSLLRNTPTIFNVGFNYFFNWDGVVTTLENHTEKVMLNPKVMGSSWEKILVTIGSEPDYLSAFKKLYPEGLTRKSLVNAMVSFERSLVTPNARFDRFLRGEVEALSQTEQAGFRLFNELGCVTCHQGINIGGNLFQKFGVFAKPQSGEGDDPGRFAITQNYRDKGVYRVPSLRNVAMTAPYFHDGRTATLEEAVDIMAKKQLGKPLSKAQRNQLVEFLNTLTGEYRDRPVTKPIKDRP